MSSTVLDHGGQGHHDAHAHDDHGHPHGWRRWVYATNHKDIGTLYLLFSLTMLMIGGVLALGIRAELFKPGLQIMNPELFNQFTTMHGIIMVFGAIMPAFVGMANWMIPLQIGASDMAFARMNNFSFWLLIPAALLLVEDNLINQRIARSLLEKAGHKVTSEADGESAVKAWRDGDFDAIFMDCHMPGMDGYEATQEIRRREGGRQRVPIIALTAAAMQGERTKALAAGMDDFLAKPIDLNELQRVLRQWVRPSTRRVVASRSAEP